MKKAVRKTDQTIDQTAGTSIPRENLSGAEALAILLLRAESVLGRLEVILPPAQSRDPDWSALAWRWVVNKRSGTGALVAVPKVSAIRLSALRDIDDQKSDWWPTLNSF